MPYRVKKQFQHIANLRTVLNGKAVALVGAHAKQTKGTLTAPPKTVQIPLATQAEMKALFERGDPTIERYDEEKLPTAKPKSEKNEPDKEPEMTKENEP